MKPRDDNGRGDTIESVPELHIRDLSQATLVALERRARLHHRSLEAEVLEILDAAAEPHEPVLPRRIDLIMANTGRTEPFDRADFYGDD